MKITILTVIACLVACSTRGADTEAGGRLFTYSVRHKSDCCGHDIEIVGKATLETCTDKCDRNGECKGFQYNTNGECYLKKYACNDEALIDTPIGRMYTKGAEFHVEGGCSVPHAQQRGHEIGGPSPEKASTASECRERCRARDDCVAAGFGNDNDCQLFYKLDPKDAHLTECNSCELFLRTCAY